MDKKQIHVTWGTGYCGGPLSMNSEGTDPTCSGLKLAEIYSQQVFLEYL